MAGNSTCSKAYGVKTARFGIRLDEACKACVAAPQENGYTWTFSLLGFLPDFFQYIRVDNVAILALKQGIERLLCDLDSHFVLRFERAGAEVRRMDHTRQPDEGIARFRRLIVVNVDASTSNLAIFDGLG